MPGENERETGGRIPQEKMHRDGNDEVSQDAAGNKPPKSGVGLNEPLSDRSESDKSDLVQRPTSAKEGRSDRNK